MEISKMVITESNEVLPDTLDIVSEKIIVYNLEKIEDIIINGKFVLAEMLTIEDAAGNLVDIPTWESMAGKKIQYNNKDYDVMFQDDPDLEDKVMTILSNSIINPSAMVEKGIN